MLPYSANPSIEQAYYSSNEITAEHTIISAEQAGIYELENIKYSIRNEMRLLEKERFELATEIVAKKSQLVQIKKEVSIVTKELSSSRETLRQVSLSQQRLSSSNINSGIRDDNINNMAPIYILPFIEFDKYATKYTGDSVVEEISLNSYSASFRSCTMSSCFISKFCTLLTQPELYIIHVEQNNQMITKLLSQLISNSAYHITEDPFNACLLLAVTSSVNLMEYLNELKQTAEWTSTQQNILLIQLLVVDNIRDVISIDLTTIEIPNRVIIASPLYTARINYDVRIPPVLTQTDINQGITTISWSHLPMIMPLKRQYFIYFAGRYTGKEFDSYKRVLQEFSDKLLDTVNISVSCRVSLSSLPAVDTWLLCGEYLDRLSANMHSVFSLVIADGNGEHIGINGLTRIVEALRNGAVPVICSTLLSLPYGEVIDWRLAVIHIPLSRFHELHYILRHITNDELVSYKLKGRFLMTSYFISAYQIILTTTSLIYSRILLPPFNLPFFAGEVIYQSIETEDKNIIDFTWKWNGFNKDIKEKWNTEPGGVYSFGSFPKHPKLTTSMYYESLSSDEFSSLPPHFFSASGITGPLFQDFLLGNLPFEYFTILVLSYKRQTLLLQQIQSFIGLLFLHKIVIVWNGDVAPANEIKHLDVGVPLIIVRGNGNSLNNRFLPYDIIETEAVFSIDDDIQMSHEEIQFAFRVWRENRHRLVGFPARFHVIDTRSKGWLYNSNYTCELSMVLTGAAFFHRYYLQLYSNWLPEKIRQTVDEYMNCEDIAMNFLIAHITREPPIKVTSRWTFRCENCDSLYEDENHFTERHACINKFIKEFGYMPLMYTQYRADSVLFKTRLPIKLEKCYDTV